MEFSDGYEGVTHAGVLVVAHDSGRMLLAQRAYDEDDAPEVRETWECPGGGLDDGEEPFAGAVRELEEEVGLPLGPHEVVHGWRAGDRGHYQGFVVRVKAETPVGSMAPDPEEVQAVGWFSVEEAGTLPLRPEVASLDLAALVAYAVSGNEGDMTDETDETDDRPRDEGEYTAQEEEPEFDPTAFVPRPIPVHGIVAPEGTETGDHRGFKHGAMTRRPLRLPFSWQKAAISGHDGSVVVGSLDRMARKDGLIHWEGLLMPSEETEQFIDLLYFFDGRYGVSVDGDKGSLDVEETKATGVMWFDKVRASGLTAVAIPAFHEAEVRFGPHPDMPDDESLEALTASGMGEGDLIGARSAFARGKGWVTNPEETSRLHRYWTQKGQPGYAKIGWGTPGDFTRAKALIGEKIAKNSPEKMRYLNQIIAQWHFDALGYWPGELDKPGNKTSAEAKAEREAKKAALSVDAGEAVEAVEAVEAEQTDSPWETVLVSSAGERVLPPASYFQRHPESGALTIEEPDENGVRRVHGYAGEWGVCHIGYEDQCVPVPKDPYGGEYRDFHLGRTRVVDEDGNQTYVNTGVITYKVSHRSPERILSETPEQAHFDDVKHAWASVRIGEDEKGVWFSGVVLPHVPEDDLTLIEATGQVSGEWRGEALRTLLAVNVPGFPVLRSSAHIGEDGEVLALVASMKPVENPPCAQRTEGSEGSEIDADADDLIGDLTAQVAERLEAKARMQEVAEKFALRRFAEAKARWEERA